MRMSLDAKTQRKLHLITSAGGECFKVLSEIEYAGLLKHMTPFTFLRKEHIYNMFESSHSQFSIK